MHQRSTASPPRKWLTVMVVFLFLCGCLPNPARAPKPTGGMNRTTSDMRENVRVLPSGRTGSDVGAETAAANQAVAAPIISHNGGSAIQGVVRVPAHIISHNGGSIISHNGGAIIGNNGGSIISHNGGSIISHNGGSIIGNNGGSFRVPQVPLANAVVRLKDAAGAPVLDSFGKAIETRTDAQGNYAFPVAVSGRNLVVHAEVPGQTGNLVALLPKDGVAQGAAIEVDLASTLTLAYVLEQYVKGNLATFERLTQEIEIKARVQTEEAIVKGAIALPETLDQGAIVAKVEEVRKAVPEVDQVFEEIRRMLVIAGIRNQGDGFPGKEVPLGLVGGLIAGDSGEVYIYSQSRQTLWKLDQNGILNTLVPGGMWGYPQELPDSWFPGYHSGMAFDSAGNLLIADVYHNRIVRVAPDRSVSLVAGGDQTGFSGDGGAASAARLNRPTGLAVDSLGYIYFSDTENHCVRRIRPDGVIEGYAGTGSAGESGDGALALNATLNRPQGLLFDSDGSLLIADFGNNKVRRVSKDGLLSTVGTIPGVIAMARKNEVVSAISHDGVAYLDIRSLVNKVELGSNFNRSLATRGDDT